jgi:hypothetical protein
MISGLVLKYLNGECFVIWRGYETTLLASTELNLTVPAINIWLKEYNHIRPHHALGMRPPVPETLLEKREIYGTEIGG